MNVLIVDDERLARNEVKRMLQDFSWISVVGEAENADEALRKINELHPDLLFLDVQMPGKTGFDLLAELHEEMPQIIFTTAYEEFALKAFEVNALDYLVKPILPERLATTLNRIKEESAAPIDQTPLKGSDRVLIRDGSRCWFLELTKIRLLESDGNYTRVHFDDERPLIYRSLTTLEQRLPEDIFFRINRQQIVNLAFIERLQPWFSNGLKIWLHGGQECEVSRRAARLFRQKLSL